MLNNNVFAADFALFGVLGKDTRVTFKVGPALFVER